eukprot:6429768-Amphidinium_carterae.1
MKFLLKVGAGGRRQILQEDPLNVCRDVVAQRQDLMVSPIVPSKLVYAGDSAITTVEQGLNVAKATVYAPAIAIHIPPQVPQQPETPDRHQQT